MTGTPPLLTVRDVRALAADFGLEPRRSLGQNFVVDPNTIRRIVRLAGVGPGDPVVEVGPGLGSLTLGLLDAGAQVLAVEKDPRMAASLRTRIEAVVGGQLEVVEADALDGGWRDRIADGSTLVANLPYNVATTIVIELLDAEPRIQRMLVMVQREVADRMAAGPGEPAHGLPSVRIARWASARRVASIGPDVFWPRPRVESALVEIVRDPGAVTFDASTEATFRALTRAGFAQRRKTLRRALAGLAPADDVVGALAAAGLTEHARAEQLSMDEWRRLCESLPVARSDEGGAG